MRVTGQRLMQCPFGLLGDKKSYQLYLSLPTDNLSQTRKSKSLCAINAAL
jgi:hypothetical protein